MTLTEKLSIKTGKDSMVVETCMVNHDGRHTRYRVWTDIMGEDSEIFESLPELEQFIHEYQPEVA